jgi:hypothetical protein
MRGEHFIKLARAIVALALLILMAMGALHLLDLLGKISLNQTSELFLAAGIAFGIVLLATIAALLRAIWRALIRRSRRVREQLGS